jgi:hypothetical protein
MKRQIPQQKLTARNGLEETFHLQSARSIKTVNEREPRVHGNSLLLQYLDELQLQSIILLTVAYMKTNIRCNKRMGLHHDRTIERPRHFS